MNAKANRLVELVDQGFEIFVARASPGGNLRLVLRQGPVREALDFAFFEVPAILAATRVVGVGQ